MHIARSVASVAALLGVLALAPGAAQANPAHHGDSAEAPSPSAAASQGQPSPQMQSGQAGGGMMGSGNMSPGNMGPGMMIGGLGPCGGMDGDKDLSAEQVKDILEGHLAWMGNERLKVGKVENADDDSYLAEIVSIDDSLLQMLAVSRKTGAMRPVK